MQNSIYLTEHLKLIPAEGGGGRFRSWLWAFDWSHLSFCFTDWSNEGFIVWALRVTKLHVISHCCVRVSFSRRIQIHVCLRLMESGVGLDTVLLFSFILGVKLVLLCWGWAQGIWIISGLPVTICGYSHWTHMWLCVWSWIWWSQTRDTSQSLKVLYGITCLNNPLKALGCSLPLADQLNHQGQRNTCNGVCEVWL